MTETLDINKVQLYDVPTLVHREETLDGVHEIYLVGCLPPETLHIRGKQFCGRTSMVFAEKFVSRTLNEQITYVNQLIATLKTHVQQSHLGSQ